MIRNAEITKKTRTPNSDIPCQDGAGEMHKAGGARKMGEQHERDGHRAQAVERRDSLTDARDHGARRLAWALAEANTSS